ncbi:hypothetical protein BST81_02560 [Leptolyngbya sp. 'hensonii']|uniref:hypothetical protein n=1 Tax=Leptolyngbya sp. 'hensonii' TaxID=1922337 RepID=UPI0009502E99|nr:hypothetical protein [Leptolyngbya sp. 'hensonii']OLP19973.1 hypothetical protein BST81_02560 [Leptolyngbya sp. 'hensonii']
MIVSRLLRKTLLPYHSHLTVVVLPDETTAFEAYRLLQVHGISPEHLAIVGEGYSSPDLVGLLQPMQIAVRKARELSFLAGTLGSIAGLTSVVVLAAGLGFPLTSTLVLLIPAGGIVAGFWGAVLGALIGFFGEGSTSGVYRHYLRQGRYLLMMEGPEKLIDWAHEILSNTSHFSGR